MTYEEWHVFVWLELIVTLVFTAEYVLRVISWPNPAKYVFSFWGFIDLATILPLYVMWLWPEISLNYVFAWRAMRAIRVLRILKLLRFMPSLRVFWVAIVSARHQLILFDSYPDRLFGNSDTDGANYHPYEQRLPEQQAATQMSELSAGKS